MTTPASGDPYGQQPYGQQEYGQQEYGQYDQGGGFGTAPVKPKNGMGIAALVFGILALLTFWLPIVGGVLGIVAIILGVVGRGRAKRREATNGGVALGGLILGVLSLIANILATILIGGVVFAFFQAGGGQTAQQYSDCLAQAPNAGNPAQVQQAFQQCQQLLQQQLPQFGGGQGGGG